MILLDSHCHNRQVVRRCVPHQHSASNKRTSSEVQNVSSEMIFYQKHRVDVQRLRGEMKNPSSCATCFGNKKGTFLAQY